MSHFVAAMVTFLVARVIAQQACGTEDAAAAAACTSAYMACVQDALANRDKYSNTCHCFTGYVTCSVDIACIQGTPQHSGFLMQCRQFCSPCNTNTTTTTLSSSVTSAAVAAASTSVNNATATSSANAVSPAASSTLGDAQQTTTTASAASRSAALSLVVAVALFSNQ